MGQFKMTEKEVESGEKGMKKFQSMIRSMH